MADSVNTIYSSTGDVVSTSVNWMRKYRVLVYAHVVNQASTTTTEFAQEMTGDIALDVSDLRCKFEIKRFALYYPNQAIITLYNLNASTENTIIQEGYRIIVEAGYDNDSSENYGQIFDGTVLMCNRWKDSGMDYILQILALDGTQFINEGYCSFTYEKGQTARSVIENIAGKASNAISLGYASPVFDTLTYSKGMVVHGLAKNTLSDIAKTANGTWFVDNGKLYVIAYADSSSDLPLGKQAVELSETTGLLGNPRQVNQGVNAKMLLNPRVVPYGLVHISNSLITQQLVSIGSYSNGISTPAYTLDPEGIYRVVSVTFTGDTRGNEWYTEITSVTQTGNIPEMLQGINGTIN
jgi:hypothetical protein